MTELLVAAAIFALIMIMVVGTFSWAAGYNSKLKSVRQIGNSGRKIMSDLSRDIRLANGKIIIGTIEYGEIVIINCNLYNKDPAGCLIAQNSTNPDEAIPISSNPGNLDDTNPNALIIVNQSQKKLILYRDIKFESSTNYDLFRKEVSFTSDVPKIDPVWSDPFNAVYNGTDLDNLLPNWTILNDVNSMTAAKTSVKVGFGGYAPAKFDSVSKTPRKQQPFCEIKLRVQSRDYDPLAVKNNAYLNLQTIVETRDYNAVNLK